MVKFLLVLAFILPAVAFTCFSQAADSSQVMPLQNTVPTAPKYFLVLDKPGKVSRLRFYTGNKITFKLVGEKRAYSGQITAVNKYSLVMWDTEIPLRDIRKIRLTNTSPASSGLQLLGRLLKNGGLFFLAIAAGNYVLNVEPGDNTLTFLKYSAGTFVAGTIITSTSRNRTYKINERNRLKTIEQFW